MSKIVLSMSLAVITLFFSSGCALQSTAASKLAPTTTTTASSAALDPTVDFTGTWKNQRDSTMTIARAADGSISGEYTTIVGGPGGRPFTRKVIGQSNGDQVAFFVDWSPYSMTAWVGQLMTDYAGKQTLETAWINTVNIPESEEPANGWAGVRNGADRFTRQ